MKRPPYALFLTQAEVDAMVKILTTALEDLSLDIHTRTAIATTLAGLGRVSEPPPELRPNGSGSKGFA